MHRYWYISLTLVFGLLIVMTSCRKKEVIYVSGQVTEGYSNDGVAGVTVELDYNEISGGSFSAGFKSLDVTPTDASGNYILEFERVQAVSYRVTTKLDGYETSSTTIGGDEWASGDDNELNLDIFETAELRIVMRNEFPMSASDRVLFTLNDHSAGCSGCCPSSLIDHVGGDTTIVCKVFANQTINYSYTLVVSGFSTDQSGSIFIQPGSESNTIEVVY